MYTKTKEKKRITVLFSGGLDSTYLVWDNLKQGNIVYPVYLTILNNEDKSLIEKFRLEEIVKTLKKEYSTGQLNSVDYCCNITANSSANGLVFKQAPFWLTAILYSNNIEKCDEIHIGYIMNDDFISYLEDFKKIYYSYQPFFDFKLPVLKFPLTKTKKREIVEKLPEDLRNLTYTCESPSRYKKELRKESLLLLNEEDKEMTGVEWKEEQKVLKEKTQDLFPGEFRLYRCGGCVACERQKYEGVFTQINAPKEIEEHVFSKKSQLKSFSSSKDVGDSEDYKREIKETGKLLPKAIKKGKQILVKKSGKSNSKVVEKRKGLAVSLS